MSDAAVELRDVFSVHRTNEGDAAALQGTNLSLAPGEVLCVLGPSGAGKSTLLRVISGIQPPSAGTVRVLGRDIARISARARADLRHAKLGFLSQHADAALPPDLRAADAVGLPLALRGVAPRSRRDRVRALLEAAGLSDRKDARPSELSGGERQRFALCAALAHEPALLLADEPTGELDERSAETMCALIAEMARAGATSVIVASHDPSTAAIADRTVRIRDGRVVEEEREGERALVVGRGGWIQLPAELLARVRIADRARVEEAGEGLSITAARVGSHPRATSEVAVHAQMEEPAAHVPVHGSRVEVHGLDRAYGRGPSRRTVLIGLSHTFGEGTLTVVTGPSGTGKTTLLRLLVGLERPDAGTVSIDDRALESLDAEELAALRRERIGYLPQEPCPVGFLSALENVVLGLRVRGWGQERAAARAANAISAVGLADRAGQLVHRLSAGEAQRVALARSLASARGLLIVDEPTSRLDEAAARAVAAMLERAAGRDGNTVICATHDPEVIARADRVLRLASER